MLSSGWFGRDWNFCLGEAPFSELFLASAAWRGLIELIVQNDSSFLWKPASVTPPWVPPALFSDSSWPTHLLFPDRRIWLIPLPSQSRCAPLAVIGAIDILSTLDPAETRQPRLSSRRHACRYLYLPAVRPPTTSATPSRTGTQTQPQAFSSLHQQAQEGSALAPRQLVN